MYGIKYNDDGTMSLLFCYYLFVVITVVVAVVRVVVVIVSALLIVAVVDIVFVIVAMRWIHEINEYHGRATAPAACVV